MFLKFEMSRDKVRPNPKHQRSWSSCAICSFPLKSASTEIVRLKVSTCVRLLERFPKLGLKCWRHKLEKTLSRLVHQRTFFQSPTALQAEERGKITAWITMNHHVVFDAWTAKAETSPLPDEVAQAARQACSLPLYSNKPLVEPTYFRSEAKAKNIARKCWYMLESYAVSWMNLPKPEHPFTGPYVSGLFFIRRQHHSTLLRTGFWHIHLHGRFLLQFCITEHFVEATEACLPFICVVGKDLRQRILHECFR